MNEQNITGFTLLGAYDSSNDLIDFKGKKFQPQITINTILPEDDTVYNVMLSDMNGFKVVIFKDGKYEDVDNSGIEIVNATLDDPDGKGETISVEEARELLLKYHEIFARQNDSLGHRCYYT